jgi:hypothetical protein
VTVEWRGRCEEVAVLGVAQESLSVALGTGMRGMQTDSKCR